MIAVVAAKLLAAASFSGSGRSAGHDAGRFAVFQVKVRDLEARTFLDFGTLRNADVLEKPRTRERLKPGSPFVRITSPRDIEGASHTA